MVAGGVLTILGGAWLALARTVGESLFGSLIPAMLVAAVTLLVAGLVILTSGLGWYVLAPGVRGGAAAKQGFGSHRLVLTSTLLVVFLSNIGPVIYTAVRPGEGLCSIPGFLTAGLSVGLALLGVTYVRFIRPGVLTFDDLGIHASRFARHVGTGLMVGVLALIASATLQIVLERVGGTRQTQLQDIRCVRDFPVIGFFAVMFAGGVLAPIAEELFFRGFVFRSYLQTRGPLVAYGASSLLFASLHLNLPALLPIMALGLLFAWAYQRTGSIVPSMVAHALNNSVAFVILYFSNAAGGVP